MSTSHGLRPFTADRFVYDGSGYVKYQTFIFSQQKQMNLAYYTGSSAFRPSNPNKRVHFNEKYWIRDLWAVLKEWLTWKKEEIIQKINKYFNKKWAKHKLLNDLGGKLLNI